MLQLVLYRRHAMHAACALALMALSTSAGSAAPEEDPTTLPTSAGAPKMPKPTSLGRFRIKPYCTQAEKRAYLAYLETVKKLVDATANEARDYLEAMRAFVNAERQAGKSTAVARDEKALDAFEAESLHRMTVVDPGTARENIAAAEASPVIDCSKPLPYDPGHPATAPAAPVTDVPMVTGDMERKTASPQRTPTLSRFHHPPPPSVRKPAPGSLGLHPSFIPPPRPGATPVPPATPARRLPPDKLPPDALHPVNPPN